MEDEPASVGRVAGESHPDLPGFPGRQRRTGEGGGPQEGRQLNADARSKHARTPHVHGAGGQTNVDHCCQ